MLIIFAATLTAAGAAEAKPKSFFGIMTQEAISAEEGAKMASGGIGAYRLPLSWDAVQSSAGAPFLWGNMDYSMRQTAAAGIRVLPIMMGTPAGFAESYKVFPIYTAEQRQGWKTYLQEAIKRYGPRGAFWRENPDLPYLPIRTWQIWNEANFIWFASPLSARDYTTLLKDSYRIVKSVDRGGKIMLSSFFAQPAVDQGIPANRFLTDIYKSGGKKFFHSTALHPYSKNAREMIPMIKSFRAVMNRYGDRRKGLSITELGWGSGTPKSFINTGSEQAQARELSKGYRFLISNRRALNISSVYWFSWKDLPATVSSCTFCYHTGLFTAGPGLTTPKPSWQALTKITRSYRGK